MRVGIAGSGYVGGTLARLLAERGHDVAVSNSRGPASLAGLVAELGDRGRAVTVEEAAAFGDVVVVAVPFGRYRDLPAEVFAGTVVVDATNYYPARDGSVAELETGETTSSALLARHLPGARVVKALNTVHWEHLRDQPAPAGARRRAVPVAGDDAQAKAAVMRLLDDLGFDAVDAGALDSGRKLQPGSPVYNVALDRDELTRRLAA